MGNKSNIKGRAYEYACLDVLFKEIEKIRPVKIEKNNNYFFAKEAYAKLNNLEKSLYKTSAYAGIMAIFDFEPFILEDGDDVLELKIQADSRGEVKDVRDILIIRKGINWEVGLSIKHNHFAVKHSRLSKKFDFAQKWFGVKSSKQYQDEIGLVFNFLEKEKTKKSLWKDIPKKDELVYARILLSFKNEIMRQNENKKLQIPQKIVEYLLGQFDFYKIIALDSKMITMVQCYNLRGTLNKKSTNARSNTITIPISQLPTRIISFDFKEGSNNTLELYMDRGWQFSFRIHNATSKVQPSLKFDIQMIGMPATIFSIDCKWTILK
ncbi:MAG: HaeIII family restriction endonuclease [Bdellovibrionota bacterium]